AAAFRDLCALVRLRWLVVDRDELPRTGPVWSDEAVSRLPLRKAAEYGRTVVYEVTAPCGSLEDRLRAELGGARQGRTLGDVPLRPLRRNGMRGRVVPVSIPSLTANAPRRIEVDLTNLGDAVW